MGVLYFGNLFKKIMVFLIWFCKLALACVQKGTKWNLSQATINTEKGKKVNVLKVKVSHIHGYHREKNFQKSCFFCDPGFLKWCPFRRLLCKQPLGQVSKCFKPFTIYVDCFRCVCCGQLSWTISPYGSKSKRNLSA